MKKNISLFLIVSLVCILFLEVASRFVLPLQGTTKREVIDVGNTDPNQDQRLIHTPSQIYRQIATEFNVTVHITEDGFRSPAPEGKPDTVFIGDSFTYGTGVEDHETFANQLCLAKQWNCANLGVEGSNSYIEMRDLRNYLDIYQWRPDRVFMVVMAMTSYLGAGNDVLENMVMERQARVLEKQAQQPQHEITDAEAAQAEKQREQQAFSARSVLVSVKRWLVDNSNLARIGIFMLGDWLRANIQSDVAKQDLTEALEATRKAFAQFKAMGDEFGFEPVILIAHPSTDVVKGTHVDTAKTLAGLTDVKVISTAPALVEHVDDNYYKLDGHFTVTGNKRVADYLNLKLP